MSTHPKTSREDALRVAEQRKAARRLRTRWIRRIVAAVATAAFVGPLGFIWAESSSSAGTTTTAAAPVTTQQS